MYMDVHVHVGRRGKKGYRIKRERKAECQGRKG